MSRFVTSPVLKMERYMVDEKWHKTCKNRNIYPCWLGLDCSCCVGCCFDCCCSWRRRCWVRASLRHRCGHLAARKWRQAPLDTAPSERRSTEIRYNRELAMLVLCRNGTTEELYNSAILHATLRLVLFKSKRFFTAPRSCSNWFKSVAITSQLVWI